MSTMPMELFDDLESLYEENNTMTNNTEVEPCEMEVQDADENRTEELQTLRCKYCHPAFSFNPYNQVIWIPKDVEGGVWKLMKLELEEKGLNVFVDGCEVVFKKHIFGKYKMKLICSPPDDN
ncbi:unnamed protein product [Ambrosiozyma monospora]|uniref:Unnamed protein product n=1 Tax=Ambrosiozyma monospora TaxID=43982 RepID=A0A9W6T943_AMBMO|nr:unnamed protein product [Ambrosiozyma monospora]